MSYLPDLPSELIKYIALKLCLKDIISFRKTCKNALEGSDDIFNALRTITKHIRYFQIKTFWIEQCDFRSKFQNDKLFQHDCIHELITRKEQKNNISTLQKYEDCVECIKRQRAFIHWLHKYPLIGFIRSSVVAQTTLSLHRDNYNKLNYTNQIQHDKKLILNGIYLLEGEFNPKSVPEIQSFNNRIIKLNHFNKDTKELTFCKYRIPYYEGKHELMNISNLPNNWKLKIIWRVVPKVDFSGHTQSPMCIPIKDHLTYSNQTRIRQNLIIFSCGLTGILH